MAFEILDWDGPHMHNTHVMALCAAYKRHMLSPEKIHEIASGVGRCLTQEVSTDSYKPVISLAFPCKVGWVMFAFPSRRDWDVHPVRVYSMGLTTEQSDWQIARLTDGFLKQMIAVDGPGLERAPLVAVK